jgi:type IV pilus assembly protein PilM
MRQLLPKLPKRTGKDTTVVGLEIEAGSIGAIEVTSNGTTRVDAAAVQPIPPEAFSEGEVTDPSSVAEALRELFSTHGLSKRVRLGIANQRVVVRTLRLPAIEDPAELDSAVRFTAQEQIAMPLEQAVIDHRVVGGVAASDGAPPQIDVLLVAARRDMISASLRPLRDAGLEPIGVDLAAFGMIRALGGGEQGATLFCEIGELTNLAVARGRSCLFTRVSPTGIADVLGSLCSATGLNAEHAKMWLAHVGLQAPVESIEGDPEIVARTRAALETGVASLRDELRLSLDFYAAQEGAVAVERIVLCGPGSAIPGLAERMEPGLELPISVASPEGLTGLDGPRAARLTVPYGLALSE